MTVARLPVVFVPGMMCDARLFGPQLAALSAGRTVACASIGHAAQVETLAARILADAPPVFALAGLSMGGIVAMEVVRQAPHRVARLALMDTNPFAELPAVQAGRAAQIARAAAELDAMMQDTFIPRYFPEGTKDAAIVQTCRDMAANLGPDVFARQSIALRDRPDQCETLLAYRGKTLILCGAEDRLCPPERHFAMKGLMPHAHLTVLERTGHLPTLERPHDTNIALLEWLDR